MRSKEVKKSRSREVEKAEVPTYTLRADCRFDILALVTIVSLAEAGGAVGKLPELRKVLREFELYEEKYLR